MSNVQNEKRRRVPRRRVLKAGIIAFNGRHCALPCTVREISATGARLRIDASLNVPDSFELIVELDGLEAECNVVHRSVREIGVRFAGPPRMTTPRRLQAVTALVPRGPSSWSDRTAVIKFVGRTSKRALLIEDATTNTVATGTAALFFASKAPGIGASREVWFVHDGYLFEITSTPHSGGGSSTSSRPGNSARRASPAKDTQQAAPRGHADASPDNASQPDQAAATEASVSAAEPTD